MATFISMLRGINVGGARPIMMDALRQLHAALGFKNVRSYLQSGNVVFEAFPAGAALGLKIGGRIREDFGFDVAVAVRSAPALAAVIADNPFLRRTSFDPAFLHATFLVGTGTRASLDGLKLPLGPGEKVLLAGDTIYLYCPNGYGNTKIHNGYFEKILSQPATTRNWRTVEALGRIAREGAA